MAEGTANVSRSLLPPKVARDAASIPGQHEAMTAQDNGSPLAAEAEPGGGLVGGPPRRCAGLSEVGNAAYCGP